MFNILKKNNKEETLSNQPIYEGANPFKYVDFSKNDVFHVSGFILYDSWMNVYEELQKIPYFFELLLIPVSINPKLSTNAMLDKYKHEHEDNIHLQNYLESLKDILPDKNTLTKNLFVIVNKENSELLVDKFKKLSFSVRNITASEAVDIQCFKTKGTKGSELKK